MLISIYLLLYMYRIVVSSKQEVMFGLKTRPKNFLRLLCLDQLADMNTPNTSLVWSMVKGKDINKDMVIIKNSILLAHRQPRQKQLLIWRALWNSRVWFFHTHTCIDYRAQGSPQISQEMFSLDEIWQMLLVNITWGTCAKIFSMIF